MWSVSGLFKMLQVDYDITNDSHHGNIMSGCGMTPHLIQRDLKFIFDDYSELSNPQHNRVKRVNVSINCMPSQSFV